MQREAQLSAEQSAHGITVLGRANHAQTGYYTQAFFALSIGLERMGKLIFLADYAIRNKGTFPTDKDLRKIGHDIGSLLEKCEEIATSLSQDRDYSVRPNDLIHRGIKDVLSLFGTKLRYYNLNHLSGADQGQHDPVALWWEKVATPICSRHYTEKQRKADAADAALMENILGESSTIIHSTETGAPINSIQRFFAQAGASIVVQKYGVRFSDKRLAYHPQMGHRGNCSGCYLADVGLYNGPLSKWFESHPWRTPRGSRSRWGHRVAAFPPYHAPLA